MEKNSKKKPTGNVRQRPKTDDEWLREAPPGIRAAVQNARAAEARERAELVDRLVENVADPEAREQLAEKLLQKPIDELQDLTALVPQREAPAPLSLNYSGQGGGSSVANRAKLTRMGLPSEYLPPDKKS
jgi:hypothetical protein